MTVYKIAFILVSMVLISSCAMTYKAPTTEQKVFKKEVSNVSESVNKIKRNLILNGFTVTYDSDNMISTMPKAYQLTTELADCGSTMGIDYLKDDRTHSKVSLNVIGGNGVVEIKSDITATYLPGNTTQSKQMNCVSRGEIERSYLKLVD